ncbi:MAG: hypothetical protein AAF289_05505 [Cyanobacteria bacterium P01_A01_bin.135]
MVVQIVSNTSPLSNLTLIGQIELLQQIYPAIVIPPSVQTELMQFSEIQPAISALVDAEWLIIKPPQDFQMVAKLEQTLDPGEAAAIAKRMPCIYRPSR